MAAATFPNSPVNGDTVVINATTYVYNSTNNSWDIPVGAGLTLPLTSLSVGAEGTPSGDGELSYNNTTGVFTYTPPVISEGESIIQGNTSVEAVDTGTGGYVAVTVDGTETARFDSAGDFQFNSGYGSVATAYGCRAWVNFNGTGTVAIRASGNVSSITDNGTGHYTINFTTAMPDANYAVVYGGRPNSEVIGVVYQRYNVLNTVNGCNVRTTNGNTPSAQDFPEIHTAIFR
jgi:hypothetical protein